MQRFPVWWGRGFLPQFDCRKPPWNTRPKGARAPYPTNIETKHNSRSQGAMWLLFGKGSLFVNKPENQSRLKNSRCKFKRKLRLGDPSGSPLVVAWVQVQVTFKFLNLWGLAPVPGAGAKRISEIRFPPPANCVGVTPLGSGSQCTAGVTVVLVLQAHMPPSQSVCCGIPGPCLPFSPTFVTKQGL